MRRWNDFKITCLAQRYKFLLLLFGLDFFPMFIRISLKMPVLEMIIRINCEVIVYPFFWTRKYSVNQLSNSVLYNCLMSVAEKILKNISHKMLKSGLEAHLKASVLKLTGWSFRTKVLLQCSSGQKIPAKEQRGVTTLSSRPPCVAVHDAWHCTWRQLQAFLGRVVGLLSDHCAAMSQIHVLVSQCIQKSCLYYTVVY